MVEYFNMSSVHNSSSMLGLAQAIGSPGILDGFYFGLFTLIIIGFVAFITLKTKGYTTSASCTVTLWFCMIVAWLLRSMSLINNQILWGVVILMILSVFALFMSNN